MSDYKEYILLNESENKFLKIDLFYELGGMSYFTNNVNRRGVYIGFRVVEKGEGWERFTLLGDNNTDFKICLKELTRLNNKLLLRYYELLKTNKDLLFNLWKENKILQIKELFEVV